MHLVTGNLHNLRKLDLRKYTEEGFVANMTNELIKLCFQPGQPVRVVRPFDGATKKSRVRGTEEIPC